MIYLILVLLAVFIMIYFFLKHPKFGQMPKGIVLEKIKNSPNYKNGQFQNLSPTPDLTDGATYYSVMKEMLFEKSKRSKPSQVLISQKTDLKALNPSVDVMIWFGHSSYFMQIEGKKILVDPVFSGAASPVKFTTRSYKGSEIYEVSDFPEIDYLFITHDHWDHLDYETILKLKPKVRTVFCGLGVSLHLEKWGYNPEIIYEKDWNEEIILEGGFVVNTTPARHFSGRGLKRNQSLWMSYILKTPTKKIFIGGDSGYDSHFKTIGEKFGPFDLAILECGQYNKSWKHIHMMPEEIIEAAKSLKATAIFPVHWGKFSLANHAWDEPINRITALSEKENIALITPMIGQKVNLDEKYISSNWWKNLN